MSTPLRERPDAPLGTLIFRAGLLPAEMIENALEEGVKTGRRLGEILIERGLLKEEDLAPLLAGQKGLPFVSLSEEGVDPSATRLLGEEQARLFQALPIGFDGSTPIVAVTDPTNEALVRNVTEAVGGEVKLVVAALTDLSDAIAKSYGQQNGEPHAEPAAATPLVTVDEPVEPAAAPEAAEPEAQPVEAEPSRLLVTVGEPVEPAAAPEAAEPEAQPVQAEPAPEPEAQPEPEPELEPAAEAPVHALEAAPAPTQTEPETVLSFQPPAREPETPAPAYRVTVKLSNDEPFVVAECADLDEAKEQAQTVIRQLAEAPAGDWPFVNGRFLKPDSIVSVDVEKL
jgi:hypothetical protein